MSIRQKVLQDTYQADGTGHHRSSTGSHRTYNKYCPQTMQMLMVQNKELAQLMGEMMHSSDLLPHMSAACQPPTSAYSSVFTPASVPAQVGKMAGEVNQVDLDLMSDFFREQTPGPASEAENGVDGRSMRRSHPGHTYPFNYGLASQGEVPRSHKQQQQQQQAMPMEEDGTAKYFTLNMPANAKPSSQLPDIALPTFMADERPKPGDFPFNNTHAQPGPTVASDISCSPQPGPTVASNISPLQTATSEATSPSSVTDGLEPSDVSSTYSPGESDKSKKGVVLPDDKKDANYWEKRRKNNESAKKSREARRNKEREISLQVVLLEQSHLTLSAQYNLLKQQNARLESEIMKYRQVDALLMEKERNRSFNFVHPNTSSQNARPQQMPSTLTSDSGFMGANAEGINLSTTRYCQD